MVFPHLRFCLVGKVKDQETRYDCPPKCPRVRKPLIPRAKFHHDLVYNHFQEYISPEHEDLVMPIMAFWHYCDHVPDLDPYHSGQQFRRSRASVTGNPVGPWPPLAQGVCPPSRDCQPCGPGPWANPQIRRFFFTDC
ncbi:uncharacterized protein LOC106012193 isoform X2 [Aplysia californica]|uniref:Uncharacterized protein LOC106012193 isoform X2 n=1 Tax=Aplysia californica TaxID=6500 RepID=A0ABM1A302_APLCA|nr:uncharacterized protein LOC106012193 isoform X2 [Aplysia californica]